MSKGISQKVGKLWHGTQMILPCASNLQSLKDSFRYANVFILFYAHHVETQDSWPFILQAHHPPPEKFSLFQYWEKAPRFSLLISEKDRSCGSYRTRRPQNRNKSHVIVRVVLPSCSRSMYCQGKRTFVRLCSGANCLHVQAWGPD